MSNPSILMPLTLGLLMSTVTPRDLRGAEEALGGRHRANPAKKKRRKTAQASRRANRGR